MRRTPTSIVGAGGGSMALPISCCVMRLVKAEVAAAWKAYCRQETPSLVTDGPARDPFLAETGNLRPHVVAHEIEFMLAIALRGMTGELRGRCRKEQPSTAGVDGGNAKHVFEEGPVGF